jgi:hypothetical protein
MHIRLTQRGMGDHIDTRALCARLLMSNAETRKGLCRDDRMTRMPHNLGSPRMKLPQSSQLL